VNGRETVVSPGRTWSIGRDAACGLVVEHSHVSRKHAELSYADGVWTYRDLGSANGSWVDGRRVKTLVIDRPVEIELGREGGALLRLKPAPDGAFAPRGARAEDERAGAQRMGGAPAAAGASAPRAHVPGAPERVLRVIERQLSVGRGPDNDLVLPDLLVSRHHAVIRRTGADTFAVADLGSTNGTFVNGRRISSCQVRSGDLISIGRHVFRFSPVAVEEYGDASGEWLSALGIWVKGDHGTPLVQGISFALEPGRLLGIVGPSGAGKTTLLRVLAAQRRTHAGAVLYGGRELASSLDLRLRMGYVPQEESLHPQLSVRRALEFAAELRFARDVEPQSRSRRVDEVLHELGLEARADHQIERLSGGERKRTGVAAELLTKPQLLFLDEPTSGLDPANEDQVTTLLRDLADGGRTVVVATHSLVTLDRCDRVLFLAVGGHQAFYGPPQLASEYFGRHHMGQTYPKVFAALDDGDGRRFASTFESDPLYSKYVQAPVAAARASRPVSAPAVDLSARSDWVRQWAVLVRRYAAVLRADRMATLILLAQAPFFAFLFNALYSFTSVMSTVKAYEATILIWLMVLGATWIGTSNAIREVVKEQSILRREHALGMSLVAYVGSKVAVLSVLTTVECAFLALATMMLQQLPPADPIASQSMPASGLLFGSTQMEITFDVVLAGLAAMAVALLVSALVRTADQANFALPLLLVAQIVLSAPVLGSPGGLFDALGTFSTAQWGMAATSSTIDLNDIRRPYLMVVENQRAQAEDREADQATIDGRGSWNHDPGSWFTDILALLTITLLSIAGLFWALVAQMRLQTQARRPAT